MRRAFLLATMIVLAACGGGGSEQPIAPPPPKASVAADLLRLYDYDAAAPLDVKETKTEQKDCINRRISFFQLSHSTRILRRKSTASLSHRRGPAG